MIRSILKGMQAGLNLAWICLLEAGRIAAAVARGDGQRAGAHARVLGIALHNDLLTGIAAVQEKFGRSQLSPQRILIVKLDRIGDMVTTTPVFDALHRLYPGARLDIVGHPGPLTLLDGDERIAERIAYRSWLYHPQPVAAPTWKDWKLVFALMRRRYPLVVYLRGSMPFLLLGLTSRLAATKFIWAEPVIDRYLKPLEKLAGPFPHPEPRLHITAQSAAFARQLLHQNGSTGPRVAIHASASAITKLWPAERFAELADELHERLGARVHFFGAADDRPTLEQIDGVSRRKHAFHWSLRLPQVVAAIAESDLFIGNDSGLAHIAAAAGTRLIVLWGSANLSMARPRFRPGEGVILYHDLPCRDRCPEFRCNNPAGVECMTRTQTADVVRAALELLGPAKAAEARGNGRLPHAGAASPELCYGKA